MSILNDRVISLLSDLKDGVQFGAQPMIEPFSSKVVSEVEGRKIVSYGASSYGYDAVLSEEDLQIFTNTSGAALDPKRPNPKTVVKAEVHTDPDGSRYVLLPPNSLMLGRLQEWYRIPRDCLVICLNKSTYVRIGVNVLVSPLEPEWEGHVTVEIGNHTPCHAKVYVNEGICQLVFLEAEQSCAVSYRDRKGKYMQQRGVTHAKA